jgi:periplasmic protein TonB
MRSVWPRRGLSYGMRAALHPPSILKPGPLPQADEEPPGVWRYDGGRRSPRVPVLAILIAASVHAFGLLGFNERPAPKQISTGEDASFLLIEMPELEELEEPEILEASDGEVQEVEASSYVPMLADVPTAIVDTSFVQEIDFSSLAPRPEFDASKVVTIPRGPRSGGVRPESMKDIFSLKDLDRVPEPVFQPPPVFPRNLKNEVSRATVTVEFIVDPTGKVTFAKVTDASYPGFDDAAIVGVMRWQFRPGMKGGKRVSTRMIVPLIFRVVDD